MSRDHREKLLKMWGPGWIGRFGPGGFLIGQKDTNEGEEEDEGKLSLCIFGLKLIRRGLNSNNLGFG